MLLCWPNLFLFAMSRCSPGYTGNPQTPGGSCQECECDQYGSMPVPCDPATGVCTCKPGFTGWKCAGCEHRYARDGMKCTCTYTNKILENTWLFSIFQKFNPAIAEVSCVASFEMLVVFLTTLAFWSIFFFFTSLETKEVHVTSRQINILHAAFFTECGQSVSK